MNNLENLQAKYNNLLETSEKEKKELKDQISKLKIFYGLLFSFLYLAFISIIFAMPISKIISVLFIGLATLVLLITHFIFKKII